MKMSELIVLLQRRLATHGDREVLVTWEGVFRSIDPESVYLGKREGVFRSIDPESVYLGKMDALLIDADDNFYKKRFAVDPQEGENEFAAEANP